MYVVPRMIVERWYINDAYCSTPNTVTILSRTPFRTRNNAHPNTRMFTLVNSGIIRSIRKTSLYRVIRFERA